MDKQKVNLKAAELMSITTRLNLDGDIFIRLLNQSIVYDIFSDDTQLNELVEKLKMDVGYICLSKVWCCYIVDLNEDFIVKNEVEDTYRKTAQLKCICSYFGVDYTGPGDEQKDK